MNEPNYTKKYKIKITNLLYENGFFDIFPVSIEKNELVFTTRH